MKHPGLLIAAGAIVLALVAGLVWSLRAVDRPAARVTPQPATQERGQAAAPAPARATEIPAGDAGPGADEIARPVRLPPVTPTGEAEVELRDHRIEGRPSSPSPIASATIADTRQIIEPAVRACVRDVHLDTPARVVVHATVRAAGSRISASDVSLSGDGALPQDARDCIIKAYQEFQTDTLPDQRDGEDVVHMPWTIQ